jgi:hypothetical protein
MEQTNKKDILKVIINDQELIRFISITIIRALKSRIKIKTT